MKQLLALLALLACTACSLSGGDGDRYAIQGLALSPDGRLAAVQFTDFELKRPGFGLYDWQERNFTPLPNPPGGRAYIDPSFSADGKSLVAVSDNQLYLIDLATLKATRITEGGQGFKESPSFAPDGSGILFVESNPARLQFVKLPERSEIAVLEAKDGFGTISRPFFGASDRVIFLATDPRDPVMAEQLQQFPDSRPATDSHVYGLKFGAMPELILKNLWIDGKARSRWFTGQHDMQASKDARRIVFLDIPEGSKDQELFEIEGNSLKQLTHLHSALRSLAMSFDGSKVAFASDPSHDMSYDLYVLDIASGKVSSTGLLGHLTLPDKTM